MAIFRSVADSRNRTFVKAQVSLLGVKDRVSKIVGERFGKLRQKLFLGITEGIMSVASAQGIQNP